MHVFYDTETTGLDQGFTQILQIGMICTDDDMNIISSKKVDCRTYPWVVPSPSALLTTGFTPEGLKACKNSNYEMMQEVNDWLRGLPWPMTVAGYNSLNYDEPVMAQNFYQSLLPSDLTTGKKNAHSQPNGRSDVMNAVKATALYMPGALKLDIMNYYGTPSMTLKNVAKENGVPLSDDDAHDALNDIRATVGVAKVVKTAAPQIWEQMEKLATVEGVNTFLGSHDVFTCTRFVYAKDTKISVMTSLAEREGSTTQALYDLKIDPTPYLTMTVDQLKDVFLKKESDRPFVLIRKGDQPVLMPMEMSEPVLKNTDDVALYTARAKTIKANKAFLDNVAKAALLAKQERLAAFPPDSSSPEMMVDKGVSASAKVKLESWAKEFHAADNWHDRAVLVEKFHTRFKKELTADPSLDRFADLATRLVYEHAPQELSAAKQEDMKKFIASRLLDPDLKAPYMTIARARKDLEKIEWVRTKPDNRWTEVADSDIADLKSYYTALEKEYAPYAPSTATANNNTPSAQSETKKPFNKSGLRP